uniref:DUF1618 domain-containing protein n=1 Tax=Setaria italica TaxID=4555 RepID=K3YCE2_SETIT
WELAAVLICGGRFWWLDLRCGLLSCSCDSLLVEDEDDSTQQPLDLEFTICYRTSQWSRRRRPVHPSILPSETVALVSISGGRLRYVEVRAHRHSRSRSPVAPPPICDDCRGGDVTSWVLDEDRGGWAEEHTLIFANVWRDESYRSSGLSKEAPEFRRSPANERSCRTAPDERRVGD